MYGFGLVPSTSGGGGSSPSTLETLLSGLGDIAKSAFDTQVQKKQLDAYTALQSLQIQNQPGTGSEIQSGPVQTFSGGGTNTLLLVGLMAAAGVAAYAIAK
jgi:hypothetical protein